MMLNSSLTTNSNDCVEKKFTKIISKELFFSIRKTYLVLVDVGDGASKNDVGVTELKFRCLGRCI